MDIMEEYLRKVIGNGDDGSEGLKLAMKGSIEKAEKRGIVGIKKTPFESFPVVTGFRDGDYVVALTASANPFETCPYRSAKSLMDKFRHFGLDINGKPVAMTNIVDSAEGDLDLLTNIGMTLNDEAMNLGAGILNGENAILPNRIVEGRFMLSGTMIYKVSRSDFENDAIGERINSPGVVSFVSNGKPIFMNCDGVGTKFDFYERIGQPLNAIEDLLAMILDDTIKKGATLRALGVSLDSLKNDERLAQELLQRLNSYTQNLGASSSVSFEGNQPNLLGFTPRYKGDVVYMNGTAISTLDREIPYSQNGDVIIALAGRPNPRSNGISTRRRLMEDVICKDVKGNFGKGNWHRSEALKEYLEFLSTPSTVFYPMISEALNREMITNFYHMSGGAYDGKFARPLRQQNLVGIIDDLHSPIEVDMKMAQASGSNAEDAYGMWPMGNEGFVTVRPGNVDEVIEYFGSKGINAKVAGCVQSAPESERGLIIRNAPYEGQGRDIRFEGN